MAGDSKDGAEHHAPLVRLMAVFYFMSSSMMVQFTTKVRAEPRGAARQGPTAAAAARRHSTAAAPACCCMHAWMGLACCLRCRAGPGCLAEPLRRAGAVSSAAALRQTSVRRGSSAGSRLVR